MDNLFNQCRVPRFVAKGGARLWVTVSANTAFFTAHCLRNGMTNVATAQGTCVQIVQKLQSPLEDVSVRRFKEGRGRGRDTPGPRAEPPRK